MFKLRMLAILAMITVFISCNKDPLNEPLQESNLVNEKSNHLLNYSSWDNLEKSFFDITNVNILSSRSDNRLSDRSHIHPLVGKVYNFLAKKNERDRFINIITVKAGFPLWNYAYIHENRANSTSLVVLPFAFSQENKITALVTFSSKNENNDDFSLHVLSNDEISNSALDNCYNAKYQQILAYLENQVYESENVLLMETYCACLDHNNGNPNDPVLEGNPEIVGEFEEDCVWVIKNLCADTDTQTGWVSGHTMVYPPHLDHDNDGIPNNEDQDWNDFLNRLPDGVTENDVNSSFITYWEQNLSDLYGEYDDFWSNYEDNWDDFYDDYYDDWNDQDSGWDWGGLWDDIRDAWDQAWDWFHDFDPDDRDGNGIDDRYEECPEWGPVNPPNSDVETSTRDVICEWFYVLECGDIADYSEWWADVFDDMIPCPNCSNYQNVENEAQWRVTHFNTMLEDYQITDQYIIDLLTPQIQSCPGLLGEEYYANCILEYLPVPLEEINCRIDAFDDFIAAHNLENVNSGIRTTILNEVSCSNFEEGAANLIVENCSNSLNNGLGVLGIGENELCEESPFKNIVPCSEVIFSAEFSGSRYAQFQFDGVYFVFGCLGDFFHLEDYSFKIEAKVPNFFFTGANATFGYEQQQTNIATHLTEAINYALQRVELGSGLDCDFEDFTLQIRTHMMIWLNDTDAKTEIWGNSENLVSFKQNFQTNVPGNIPNSFELGTDDDLVNCN